MEAAAATMEKVEAVSVGDDGQEARLRGDKEDGLGRKWW